MRHAQTPDPVVFFLGAGASIYPPSSLPLANTLKEQIFLAIGDQLRYRPEVDPGKLLQDFPLEFLLQVVKDRAGEIAVWDLLQPLKGGDPNAIHHGIAHLASRGLCTTVFTVNFDGLLEAALGRYGVPFQVFSDADVPDPFPDGRSTLYLYKLHGSLAAPSSIVATLEAVGQPMSDTRGAALRESLRRRRVVFLGYRGADTDIRPIVKESLQGINDVIWSALSPDGIDPELASALHPSQVKWGDGLGTFLELLQAHGSSRCPTPPSSSAANREVIRRVLEHVGQVAEWNRLVGDQDSMPSARPLARFEHCLSRFHLEVRSGRWSDAERWLDAASQAAKGLGRNSVEPAEMKLAFERAKFRLGLGEPDAPGDVRIAVERFQSTRASRSSNWHVLVGRGLLLEQYPLGISPGADPWEELSDMEARAGSDEHLRAVVARTRGILLYRLGRPVEASNVLADVRTTLGRLADRNGVLVTRRYEAAAARAAGDFAAAHAFLTDALEWMQSEGLANDIRLAELLEEEAVLLASERRWPEAIARAMQCKKAYSRIGCPRRGDALDVILSGVSRSQR